MEGAASVPKLLTVSATQSPGQESRQGELGVKCDVPVAHHRQAPWEGYKQRF